MKTNFKMIVSIILMMAVALPVAAENYSIIASNISGQVLKSSGGDWTQVRNHDKLAIGDKIKTGTDGSVILTFDESNVLSLSPLTQISLSDVSRSGSVKKSSISLENGRMLAVARKLKNTDSVFEVRTPEGVAAVRGSEVVASAKDGTTVFQVIHGVFNVTINGNSSVLEAGFQMDIISSMMEPPDPMKIDPAVLQGLKKEADSKKEAGVSAGALSNAEDVSVQEMNEVMEMLERANQGSCYTVCYYWEHGQCVDFYEHCGEMEY